MATWLHGFFCAMGIHQDVGSNRRPMMGWASRCYRNMLEENVKDFTSEKWEMVDLATQKSEKKNLPFGYD